MPVDRVRMPRHGEWITVLAELATQLGAGRIYGPELSDLRNVLTGVIDAYRRDARRVSTSDADARWRACPVD
jgi:hypothetical protein